MDKAPAQTYAELLDEGTYVCLIRTMYRVLAGDGEVRERRRQATHPAKVKPELCAAAPNEVWSWDITKLRGPSKGCWYHLYVIIDLYSRYVPGWLLAETESAELAKRLLGEAIDKQQVARDRLTIHADRGTSMASKPVAVLLADLGVTKSHSRPRCSNDNPYSEAGFKTLKYCPAFPDRFGSIPDARAFCRTFFGYYNHEHRLRGSGCSRRPMCTTAAPPKSAPPVKTPWTARTPLIPSGSSASPLLRPRCLSLPGLTSPNSLNPALSKSFPYMSQIA